MSKSNHNANKNLSVKSGKKMLVLFCLIFFVSHIQAVSHDFEKSDSAYLVSDEKTPTTIIGKVYIVEGTVTHNFDKDDTKSIVYLKKESKSEKIQLKPDNHKKQSKIPLPPPMVKKDAETENRKSVLSFSSREKTPSALFYSGKTTKGAIVQSGSFVVKLFPQKKSSHSIIHAFFLNENRQIKKSFAEVQLQPQVHLKNQITRPPPILT